VREVVCFTWGELVAYGLLLGLAWGFLEYLGGLLAKRLRRRRPGIAYCGRCGHPFVARLGAFDCPACGAKIDIKARGVVHSNHP
jgi:DNA-directed RNA polymerase subunit RPC12/RpoP